MKKVYFGLLTEEIAGFYDPDSKQLYLIDESATPNESAGKRGLWERLFGSSDAFDAEEQKTILCHEMEHALADQHFDLHSLTRSTEDDDDVAIAVSSLIEGEAVLVMLVDMIDREGGDGRKMLESAASFSRSPLVSVISSIGAFFASGKSFRRAPLLLREVVVFPYLQGLIFCGSLTIDGRWDGVNKAFQRPPLSSEQILHPEKYLAASRDDPVSLSFPDPAPLDGQEWGLVKKNVLGELGIEVLLRPKIGKRRSARAAAGWDGDAYHVFRKNETPQRVFLAWVSTWDSEEEAREFVTELLVHCETDEKVDGANAPDTSVDFVLPEGIPDAKRIWKAHGGISGIWQRGVDVWLLDGAPRDQLAEVVKWSFAVESRPKKAAVRKFRARVEFEASVDREKQNAKEQ